MPRVLLALAILCHVLLSSGYLVWTPAFEGPDEPGHFAYAQHIANAGQLPIVRGSATELGRSPLDEADMAHHPPLYYGLLAATLAITGRSDTLHTPRANPNNTTVGTTLIFLHGGDERAPRSAGVLTLLLLRAWSVALGVVSLLLVYRLGRLSVPTDPMIAAWACLSVACLPMWSFLHGVVNSDTLATTLSLAALVAIVEWHQCERWTTGRAIALGCLLGLGLTTKLTCVFLFALAGATWVARFAKRPNERARHLRHGGWVAIACLAICGWWIGRNVSLFGDPLGLASHGATFDATRIPHDLRWTWIRDGFLPQIFTSLLGTFGWFRLWPADWLVWFGVTASMTALVGMTIRWRRRDLPHATPILFGAMFLVFTLTLQFNLEFRQPQGRLLFPALGAAAVWFALGLVTVGRALATRLPAVLSRCDAISLLPAFVPPSIAAWVLLGWFLPAFDTTTAIAPAHTAAIVGSVLPDEDSHAWTWVEPGDGFESTDAPPTWRVDLGDSDDGVGPCSFYVWDATGRIWLATWEWAEFDLDPSGAFSIPVAGWDLLPTDRDLFARLRRVPDWRAAERLVDVPASNLIRFRKTGQER